jgi:cysteine rich repeat protein
MLDAGKEKATRLAKNLLIAIVALMACEPSCAPMDKLAQDRVCEGDVKSLCAEVSDPRPGDDRVLSCLERHQAQLTEACKKNVESHQKTQ